MKELISHIQTNLAQGKVDADKMQTMKECLNEAVERFKDSKLVQADIAPGRYLCHQDDEHDFVVMFLSWEKGAETPIHTHSCWGLETVIRGQLKVVEYDDNPVNPQETKTILAGVGDQIFQLPPKKDVHKVMNTYDGRTYSIHVYGRQMCNNLMFKPGQGYVPCSLETEDLNDVFDIFKMHPVGTTTMHAG